MKNIVILALFVIFYKLSYGTPYNIPSRFDSCTIDSLPIEWIWNGAGICKLRPYQMIGSDTIWGTGKKGYLLYLQKNSTIGVSPSIKRKMPIAWGRQVVGFYYGSNYYLELGYTDHRREVEFELIGFNNKKGVIDTIYKRTYPLFLRPDKYNKLIYGTGSLNLDSALMKAADSLQVKITFLNPTNKVNNFILLDDVSVIFDDLTTGVKEETNTSNLLTLYPNPTQNTLHINTTQEISGSLCLQDVSGKQILQQQNFNTNQTIDVANLPKGIYIVTLKNNTAMFYSKFIKE